MSASTNFSFSVAGLPADPAVTHGARFGHAAARPGGADDGGTSRAATASTQAGAAFEAVPPTSGQAEQRAALPQYRREGDSGTADAGAMAKRCYYPVRPIDNVPPDADGKIRGAELKGTRTYERLVHALSIDTRHPTRPPSAGRVASAEAAINGMRLPLGSTVVAPCHQGHDERERSVSVSAPATDTTPAPRTRRALPESTARHMNDGAAPGPSNGSQPTIQAVPGRTGTKILGGIVDPCRPVGLWQRVFDAIARFVGAYTHPATVGDPPSASNGKPADACPSKPETTDEEIRNYENYLLAWTTSFTRRRRVIA